MFFVSGLAFCSPLGINIIYFCETWDVRSSNGFTLSIPLFIFGFYLIIKSHDIMVKSHEQDV